MTWQTPKMQEEPPVQTVEEKSQLSEGRLRCLTDGIIIDEGCWICGVGCNGWIFGIVNNKAF